MPRLSKQPIKSRKNEYKGPNAHLLSLQQTPRPDAEMWHSFHGEYIAAITFALNERLPEGYTAYGDQSLQVELEWPDMIEKRPLRIPDVSAYREPDYQATSQTRTGIQYPSLVFPLRESGQTHQN